MIQYYYQDELRYLYQAGKEFAQSHPDIARYLHIDSESKDDRDPYVERLFEGFAFLTGRIRERLDDELPELAESLCAMLWPQYLKPVPSISVVEFKPRPGLIQETTVFPVGTEVQSVPAGEEATVCRFRTTHDVLLNPIKLSESTLSWPSDGTTTVTLRFTIDRGAEYNKLRFNPLRLYFHAEDSIASMMHLFFSRHVRKVMISAGNSQCELDGPICARPAGLSTDDALLPYSRYAPAGFRLLHEYLSFRRKFWFVDLFGMDQLNPPAKTAEFQIQCFFDRPFPEEKKFTADNIRLFCAPVINLFHMDAEPIRMDHLQSEYRVIPDIQHPKSHEIYSMESIIGTEESTGQRHTYHPLFSVSRTETREDDRRYFNASTRIGPSGQRQTFVSLGGFTAVNGDIPVETLSPEITATNGSLPREKLQERTITQPAPDFSNIASFENLTQPTLDLRSRGIALDAARRPEDNFLWKVISHLSLNFMSIATLKALRGILELYDWTGSEANRRRIAGLRNVTWASKEILFRSSVVRGAEVTVEVQDGHFADEGDLCLFGLVLSEFFSAYATINSFVHLHIVTKPSELHYRWEPRRGNQSIV
jgi:type VI secretion system protein ImpG